MAKRPDPKAKAFARYVSNNATRAGYAMNSSSGDGKAKLAQAAQMPEADISRILAGEYEVPTDLLKPLAAALDIPQKDPLRAAGILEDTPAQANRPLTVQLAAQRLGIKSPKNAAAFEVLVTALVEAEKRHR